MAPKPNRVSILAGAAVALVVLLLPLTVLSMLDNPDPELRLLISANRSTALIVDRGTRILIVNETDRERARSLNGHLARPWEPRPQLLIAPADDAAAIGLLEAIRSGVPEKVLVAGVPGADPLWIAIEAECVARGIDLQYITVNASVSTSRLQIRVVAPEPEQIGDRLVIVQHGDTRVVVALDAAMPTQPAHVLVGSRTANASVLADLIISADDLPRSSTVPEVIADPDETVTVAIAPSTIRVFGGALRVPHAGVERQ